MDAGSSKGNFHDHDLTGQDFSNRILIGADFSNCKCAECDFSGSDLSFANFKNANLYRANFSNAILYVTYFVDCDLTRANFEGAHIYGVKFSGNVNITYANFSTPKLESERRFTSFPNINNRGGFKRINFNELLQENEGARTFRDLYGVKFTCNEHYMEFVKYKKYEKEMEFSQIYNRLKRIYKENNFPAEAGGFYFLEKYWQTRSWFTEGSKEDFEFGKSIKRVFKTCFSLLNESICGYGEKPLNVLYWMLAGMFVFAVLYSFGSFREANSSSIGLLNWLGTALYYSLCSFVSVNSNLTPEGFNKTLTIIEAVYSLIMTALFTATIVRKFIRD